MWYTCSSKSSLYIRAEAYAYFLFFEQNSILNSYSDVYKKNGSCLHICNVNYPL